MLSGGRDGGMLEPQPSPLSPPEPHHPVHEALLCISLPNKET